MWPFLAFVAHFGTGPVSVSCSVTPRRVAESTSRSSRSHVPAGYLSGSAVSNCGSRFEFGCAENSRQ